MPEQFDVASILEDVLGEPLRLTFRGETYTAPPVDTRFGIEIETKFAAIERDGDSAVLSDELESQFYARLWGAEWDRIADPANGVPWAVAKLMGTTALIDARYGREVAMLYWTNGGQPPKAPEPGRPEPQDRLQKSGKKKQTGSKKG